MSYTPLMAAALSGATLGQLGYWRRGDNPVLRPEVRDTRPVLYSFRDVVALRTCVYLRRDASLQMIRKALDSLGRLGEHGHLSEYRLVAEGGTIILVRGADEAVDLVKHPGHQILAVMADVLGEFRTADLTVPAIYHPRKLISVDPEVRGGWPVVAGTRVPYNLVAGLVRDGVQPRHISSYYPSVSAEAARQAADFGEYVQGFTSAANVA